MSEKHFYINILPHEHLKKSLEIFCVGITVPILKMGRPQLEKFE